MTKIDTKIKYYTLQCICSLHDGISEIESYHAPEVRYSKEFRAANNIINLLVIKFKKKLLNKSENCKPFKISLEYYQAYFLINFISANSKFFTGILEKTLLHQFTQRLHQQL